MSKTIIKIIFLFTVFSFISITFVTNGHADEEIKSIVIKNKLSSWSSRAQGKKGVEPTNFSSISKESIFSWSMLSLA